MLISPAIASISAWAALCWSPSACQALPDPVERGGVFRPVLVQAGDPAAGAGLGVPVPSLRRQRQRGVQMGQRGFILAGRGEELA